MSLPVITRHQVLALAKPVPLYYRPEEVARMLDALSGRRRDFLFVSLLWQTGARVSEALGIRPRDIDFYGRTLTIVNLKARGPRPSRRGRSLAGVSSHHTKTIPLKPDLIGQLGAYIASEQIGQEERVFNFGRRQAQHIIRRAAREAGINDERAHPHTFRHSFAIHCLLSGAPLLAVQTWLGHRSIASMMPYLKVLALDTHGHFAKLEF